MGKSRIGNLKGVPIVDGPRNQTTSHEYHISEIALRYDYSVIIKSQMFDYYKYNKEAVGDNSSALAYYPDIEVIALLGENDVIAGGYLMSIGKVKYIRIKDHMGTLVMNNTAFDYTSYKDFFEKAQPMISTIIVKWDNLFTKVSKEEYVKAINEIKNKYNI